MSGECDDCGEHVVECVCKNKPFKGRIIMRNRLEDLGRLLVLLEKISIADAIHSSLAYPKYAADRFFEMTKEKQEDTIHCLACCLQNINEQINECVLICRAHDDLNASCDK